MLQICSTACNCYTFHSVHVINFISLLIMDTEIVSNYSFPQWCNILTHVTFMEWYDTIFWIYTQEYQSILLSAMYKLLQKEKSSYSLTYLPIVIITVFSICQYDAYKAVFLFPQSLMWFSINWHAEFSGLWIVYPYSLFILVDLEEFLRHPTLIVFCQF